MLNETLARLQLLIFSLMVLKIISWNFKILCLLVRLLLMLDHAFLFLGTWISSFSRQMLSRLSRSLHFFSNSINAWLCLASSFFKRVFALQVRWYNNLQCCTSLRHCKFSNLKLFMNFLLFPCEQFILSPTIETWSLCNGHCYIILTGKGHDELKVFQPAMAFSGKSSVT